MAMQAVIMAGGAGMRLRPMTCDCPKPLVPLCGGMAMIVPRLRCAIARRISKAPLERAGMG